MNGVLNQAAPQADVDREFFAMTAGIQPEMNGHEILLAHLNEQRLHTLGRFVMRQELATPATGMTALLQRARDILSFDI